MAPCGSFFPREPGIVILIPPPLWDIQASLRTPSLVRSLAAMSRVCLWHRLMVFLHVISLQIPKRATMLWPWRRRAATSS